LREVSFAQVELDVLGPPPAFPSLVRIKGDLPVNDDVGLPAELMGEETSGVPGPAFVAAAADGVIPGLQYAWTWAHVDSHVFDAIGHMTHKP